MKYKDIKITKNPKPTDNITFIDSNNQPEQQQQQDNTISKDNNKDKIVREARMSKNKGKRQKNKTIIKTNIESQTPNFG
jgi:hypothetical protein